MRRGGRKRCWRWWVLAAGRSKIERRNGEILGTKCGRKEKCGILQGNGMINETKHTPIQARVQEKRVLFFVFRLVKRLVLFRQTFSHYSTFSIILGDRRKVHLCIHSVFSSCFYVTPRGARQIHYNMFLLEHRLDLAKIHHMRRGRRSRSRTRSQTIGGRRACMIIALHRWRTPAASKINGSRWQIAGRLGELKVADGVSIHTIADTAAAT